MLKLKLPINKKYVLYTLKFPLEFGPLDPCTMHADVDVGTSPYHIMYKTAVTIILCPCEYALIDLLTGL